MRNYIKKAFLLTSAFLLAFQLSGCQTAMPKPVSSIENSLIAQTIQNATVKLGTFQADKAVNDKAMSIRADSLISSTDKSFAQHLRQTLYVELDTAKLLDQASDKEITGILTKSDLSSVGTGNGVLSAKFTVKQGENILFDKELEVKSTWESSFIAAIAVPKAIIQYEDLYRKLVGKLLSDPDFQKAIKK